LTVSVIGGEGLPVPWKVSDVLDERVKFVSAALRGDMSLAGLCRIYGISRETGYKWLERYHRFGWGGLGDASRAPHRQANAMSSALSGAVLSLRRAHPFWGPKKLLAVLSRDHPERDWPAASTIGDLLRREGLVVPRRRRVVTPPCTTPFAAAVAANDLWCIDFKGWFRTQDGKRCDPLTVSDAVSRYLLVCEIVPVTSAGVGSACERLFRERGLPAALRMDNGTPFAANGVGGLTRLAVSWIKLGIRLERIDPGCPQQNGRHERMHRTLKAETSSPPAATPVEQQARFDRFRQEFNEVRPHEALGQATPASRHADTARPYPSRIAEPWYDADHQVRRVRHDGLIQWRGAQLFISEALAGEPLGLKEIDDGQWLVRFADLDLGIIGPAKTFNRLTAPRPGRRQATSNRNSVNHVSGL
jgi:transposase InsO family protein